MKIALQSRVARLESLVPIPIAPVEMESVYAAIREAIAAHGIVQGSEDSWASCWARSLGCTSSELAQALRDRAQTITQAVVHAEDQSRNRATAGTRREL